MSTRASGALVFTDLAGFTAFTAAQGDAAAVDLVERFESIARAVLPVGGRIVKQLGDGLFLYVPEADAAIPMAISLGRRCAEASRIDAPLWVRTGVHVGSAIARGDDLIGHDVNLTSRITDLAAPGEVLVSQAARDQHDHRHDNAPFDVVFEPLGPVFVKGVDEALKLFRASAPGLRRSAHAPRHRVG